MVGRMCSRPGGALLGVALSVCLKGNLLPERTVGVETSGITVNRHQAMRPQSQVTIVKTRATVDSQVALVVNNPPANTGDIRDTGSIPGSGRSPGGGHGNPLHYSCLENPMDRGAWHAKVHRVAKSWIWPTWLSMCAPWIQHLSRSSRYYSVLHLFVKAHIGTSLVVQWLRICLATQGMRVQPLIGKLRSQMQLGQLSPSATTTEPSRHN